MNSLKALPAAVCLYLASLAPLHALVGETIKECDERYGETKFSHTKGHFELRTYAYKGKRVDSTFHKGVCVFERVIVGPGPVKDARKFGEDAMRFLRNHLTKIYGFTEAQLDGLMPLKDTSPQSTMTGTVENGDLRAAGILTVNEDGSRAHFTVVTSKATTAVSEDAIADFQAECTEKEIKERAASRAGGS